MDNNILQNPVFQDETLAREWLEERVWPNGPACPHCGNADRDKITNLKGKAHRAGLYQCNECREQFTVTVGTVFERSKIPLTKWLAVLFLLTSSKKGISTHQLHRMIGVSYKSTWFMTHRLRLAMAAGGIFPASAIGGEGKVVEADETYFGKVENPSRHPIVVAVPIPSPASQARPGSARCSPLSSAAAKLASSTWPRPTRRRSRGSCARTSRREPRSTRMRASSTPARMFTLRLTKPSSTATANTSAMRMATRYTATLSRVCSLCSNVA
jgi:transposase-like protein